MDQELTEYPLFDNDGKKYVAYVPPREANILDMYANKRHRLLAQLKASSQPVEKWDNSLSQVAEASSSSMWQPPAAPNKQPATTAKQPRSKKCDISKHYVDDSSAPSVIRLTGKCGGVWNDKTTSDLVNCCLPYRKWLREAHVSEFIWEQVSDKLLKNYHLNYSWEQCKEKMRLLRQKFEKAKLGQLKGDQWPNFYLFVYIYDEVLEDGHVTLAPDGFLLDNQNNYSAVFQNAEIMSSTTCEDEQVASSIDNDVQQLDQISGMETLTVSAPDEAAGLTEEAQQSPTTIHVPADPMQLPAWTAPDEAAGLTEEAQQSPTTIHVPADPTQLPAWTAPGSALRSPAAKKVKGVFVIPHRSPVKTPKRKTAKKDLQWDTDDVDTFLAFCEAKKEVLVLHPTVPVKTWKELSTSLELMQIHKSWETCRDKFTQMLFFFKNVLPTEGKMGSSIWPYFQTFCSIYDVPPNYHALTNNDHDHAAETNGRIWTPERVRLLISLYKAKSKYFFDTKSMLRHDVLWAQISEEMRGFKHDLSWKQCKAHMSSLKQKFNEEYEAAKKTGAAPSKWDYFDEMSDLLGGTATLEAPYLVSAGRGMASQANGEPELPVERHTRTRPQAHRSSSNSTAQGTNKYSSKPKKQAQSDIQERKLDQTERMIAEVSKIRYNMERNAAVRSLVYKELLGKNKHAAIMKQVECDEDGDDENDIVELLDD